MKDMYSASKYSKKYTNKADAAAEYLGRDPEDGDIVCLHVHSEIMSKVFLQSFTVSKDT